MTEKHNSISIFISSHKPAEHIEGKYFIPIQVGAALPGKKKIDGFIQDNIGDNISDKNLRFCELTAQYWAWKNTDSEYYGFFHYRRYLGFNTSFSKNESIWGTLEEPRFSDSLVKKYNLDDKSVKALVEQYDIVLPEIKDITVMPGHSKNIRQQYASSGYLHEKDLDIMMDVLKEKYPDFYPYAISYMDGHKSYLNNMFIMKKEVFAKYCAWLFDILFECDKRIDYTDYSVEAIRTPGHLAERLLNIYIAYLKDNNDYKIKELPTIVLLDTEPMPEIAPAFKKNNIAIALSANNFYVPYVATVISSILQNSSDKNNYDILLMHKDITSHEQTKLKSIIKDNDNFSLRFINISRFDEKFKPLFLRGHFTIETWFRLLMPEIMPKYDKILYLDSDLVVNADIAELYDTNIEGYLLAACHDADTAGLYNGFEPAKKEYMDNILKNKNPYNYFQAGVILFNLAEFRKQLKTEEMLKFAASYEWELLDQDVLNYLAQDKVKFVDMAWNVMFDWRFMRINEIISRAPKYLSDEYARAHSAPKIIHYAGPDKPWNDPGADYAELFWKYARETPYYEETILRMSEYRAKLSKPSVIKRGIKKIAKSAFPERTKRGAMVRRIYTKIRK